MRIPAFFAALAAAFGAMILSSTPAHAGVVSGQGRAIDGDSLMVGDVEVRLHGIDAPEFTQPCRLDGQQWMCGEEAKRQLQSLLSLGPVSCIGDEKDDYGRLLALCQAGGFELNRTMVEEGWATAYRNYSQAYIAEEARAKAERSGIWRAEFDPPQQYRMAQEAPVERAAPRPASRRRATAQPPEYRGGCNIKGNHSRRGEWIYHVPGMPYYNETRPEQMFCTEAAARAAGYRRAIVK